MYNKDTSKNDSPICDFVPGYAFYSNLSEGLAESLMGVIEFFIDIVERLRR